MAIRNRDINNEFENSIIKDLKGFEGNINGINIDELQNEFVAKKVANELEVEDNYGTIIQVKIDEINSTDSPLAKDMLRASKGVIEGFEHIAKRLSGIEDSLDLVSTSILSSSRNLTFAIYDFMTAQSTMLYDIKKSLNGEADGADGTNLANRMYEAKESQGLQSQNLVNKLSEIKTTISFLDLDPTINFDPTVENNFSPTNNFDPSTSVNVSFDTQSLVVGLNGIKDSIDSKTFDLNADNLNLDLSDTNSILETTNEHLKNLTDKLSPLDYLNNLDNIEGHLFNSQQSLENLDNLSNLEYLKNLDYLQDISNYMFDIGKILDDKLKYLENLEKLGYLEHLEDLDKLGYLEYLKDLNENLEKIRKSIEEVEKYYEYMNNPQYMGIDSFTDDSAITEPKVMKANYLFAVSKLFNDINNFEISKGAVTQIFNSLLDSIINQISSLK